MWACCFQVVLDAIGGIAAQMAQDPAATNDAMQAAFRPSMGRFAAAKALRMNVQLIRRKH